MRILVCISLCVLGAALLAAQTPAQDSDELEAYVAKIREWRMTESARISLRTVANVLSEQTLLLFNKDDASGAYWKRFQSTSCPNPDMTPAERASMLEEYESKISPIIAALFPLADRDSSGFISEIEAAQFRNLVEFGYQAAYVAAHEEASSEQFFRGMSMDREHYHEQAAAYANMRLKARAAGLDLPALEQ